MQNRSKLLTIVLAAAIFIVSGIIVYLSLTPAPGDKFTEFYMLNADGRAADYPQQVDSGQPVRLKLGVVNHEMADTSYKVKLLSKGAEIAAYDIGRLPDGGRWEQAIGFTPGSAGAGQKYEFFLYSTASELPHIKDPLVLRLDIK